MTDSKKQKLKGRVISVKPSKTAIVEVSRRVQHQKYKKYFKSMKKYSAHYDGEVPKVGDNVVIESSRPLSKMKKWAVKK